MSLTPLVLDPLVVLDPLEALALVEVFKLALAPLP